MCTQWSPAPMNPAEPFWVTLVVVILTTSARAPCRCSNRGQDPWGPSAERESCDSTGPRQFPGAHPVHTSSFPPASPSPFHPSGRADAEIRNCQDHAVHDDIRTPLTASSDGVHAHDLRILSESLPSYGTCEPPGTSSSSSSYVAPLPTPTKPATLSTPQSKSEAYASVPLFSPPSPLHDTSVADSPPQQQSISPTATAATAADASGAGRGHTQASSVVLTSEVGAAMASAHETEDVRASGSSSNVNDTTSIALAADDSQDLISVEQDAVTTTALPAEVGTASAVDGGIATADAVDVETVDGARAPSEPAAGVSWLCCCVSCFPHTLVLKCVAAHWCPR
jgi:hypothetical protein